MGHSFIEEPKILIFDSSEQAEKQAWIDCKKYQNKALLKKTGLITLAIVSVGILELLGGPTIPLICIFMPATIGITHLVERRINKDVGRYKLMHWIIPFQDADLIKGPYKIIN